MARVNEVDDDDDLEAVDIEDGVDERPSHQRRGEILEEDNRTHPWDSTSDVRIPPVQKEGLSLFAYTPRCLQIIPFCF